MNKYDKETLIALERAIKSGEECYYAFNHLALETHVEFKFYGTDLYDALIVCKAWKDVLAKKEGD